MIICAERVIVGDGSTVYLDSGVLVDGDGRIARVGKAALLKKEHPGEEVVCYPGSTLLPGLVDMHGHLGHFLSNPPKPVHNDFMMAYLALSHAQTAFSYGVTAIRDMCSPANLGVTMNAAAQANYITIPRLFPCGKGICMTGGHGSQMGEGEAVEEIDTPWALRIAVRKRIKSGGKWVKILTSHRTNMPEFTQEELNAAVDECHRLGGKIAVHAGTQPSIQMCIDAGFDTIEHATFMTEHQAQQMKEKGIAWIPTILPYTSAYETLRDAGEEARKSADYRYYEAAAAAYRDNFLKLAQTGVKMAAGTDMVVAGRTETLVARELAYMVEYGLTPLEAIRAGTSSGAELLDAQEEFGLVKPGLRADLLIVDGDPSLRIEDLRNVRRVFQDGHTVYEKPLLPK